MDIQEEEEIKKEFQLERVILFTDAVFAIIITLMVLDLHLPEGIRDATTEVVRDSFFRLILKGLGYLVSFFLVARFWVSHLRMFRFLKDYTYKLVFFNLMFLFFVSLFPFGISLISGNIHLNTPAYSWGSNIYLGIIFMCFFSQTLLINYMVKNKQLLCFTPGKLEDSLKWKAQRLNFILVPFMFVCMYGISLLNLPPNFTGYTIFIYALSMGIATKRYYPKGDMDNPILATLFGMRKKIKPGANVKKVEQD